jgi:ABC-2 type transport system ATP-binding protein
MRETAIRAAGLSKRFGSVDAVRNLDLEIPSGIIFGFLGPNGSGKTTTINLLLGLLEPSSGCADVLGFDVGREADELRAHTGALLEHSGIYEQMSAEENLEYFGRIYGMPVAERDGRIRELLDQMRLWERRAELVGTWSRGMQQKLAVARAILHRPAVVFLDEPTAGLDVVAASALREDLAKLVAREGTTVFLTTHNMVEAEKLCDRVAVIRNGELLAVGHPDEIRARAGGPHVEITGSAFDEQVMDLLRAQPTVAAAARRNGHISVQLREGADTAELVRLLVAAGAQVEEVRRGQASLEEAFLTMMEEEECSPIS